MLSTLGIINVNRDLCVLRFGRGCFIQIDITLLTRARDVAHILFGFAFD